jgi:hypothetical protein
MAQRRHGRMSARREPTRSGGKGETPCPVPIISGCGDSASSFPVLSSQRQREEALIVELIQWVPPRRPKSQRAGFRRPWQCKSPFVLAACCNIATSHSCMAGRAHSLAMPIAPDNLAGRPKVVMQWTAAAANQFRAVPTPSAPNWMRDDDRAIAPRLIASWRGRGH